MIVSGPSSFQTMEKSILDLISVWSKDHFRVNNILYEKDQTLCTVLETSIWVRNFILFYFILFYFILFYHICFYLILSDIVEWDFILSLSVISFIVM